MESFRRLEAIAAPMLRNNIDTDAIIPVAHMKTMSGQFGQSLFANLRYRDDGSEDPEFVLNRPEYRKAQILVAGENFGCGSSREHAVWALLGFGIRCVIASSYGDIFYNNSFQMGLLPIVLSPAERVALGEEVTTAQGARPTIVDLEKLEILGPAGSHYRFEVKPLKRRALLDGLDAVGVTLLLAEEIETFEARDQDRRPWIHELALADKPLGGTEK